MCVLGGEKLSESMCLQVEYCFILTCVAYTLICKCKNSNCLLVSFNFLKFVAKLVMYQSLHLYLKFILSFHLILSYLSILDFFFHF